MQAFFDELSPMHQSPIDVGCLSVSLFEVLNNSIKIAYCGNDNRFIEITCQRFDDFLSFDIAEEGL
jgi:hypothetical protein